MTKNKIVLPGEQVSTSEELLPGDGTFEEDGIIRAERIGTYEIDEKYRQNKEAGQRGGDHLSELLYSHEL